MRVAVIGGTGVAEIPLPEEETVKVPYKSIKVPFCKRGKINGVEVLFLNRHGLGFGGVGTPAHRIDHVENVSGLKKAGAEAIVAVSACGSLQRDLEPGQWVLPSDFMDFSRHDLSALRHIEHPSSLNPFNRDMKRAIANAFHCHQLPIRDSVPITTVTIHGPRFATRAESQFYQRQAHLINMTTAPEVSVALELGIPYVLLTLITDYDSCAAPPGELPTSHELIKQRFAQGLETLHTILPTALSSISSGPFALSE
jgi:5'-methylthioadenosine phosphorylase